MSERKKVLWLVSWYPNKYDRFDGDFIQRHARAASLYDDIHVLFIKAFDQQKEKEQEFREENGLAEQIIYLPKRKEFAGKLASFFNWQKQYQSEVSAIFKKHAPELIHVHIPWKVGLIALWAKKEYKIPFVVTEHWGIYNDVVEDNIHTKSALVRYLLQRIYKEAHTFTSVSKYLGDGVNKTLLKKEFLVIPNVVDTRLFKPSNEKYDRFTFLHVSNMVPLKNVEGILHAFSQFLKQSGTAAQLVLVGNRNDQYEKIAEDLKLLNTAVFFLGEVSYAEVAKEIQRSHAFILNSNIENSPCVIGEALCCGLPVLTTTVGGIPELVNGNNSLLISPGNSEGLAMAMVQLKKNYSSFNSAAISTEAMNKFSMASVGRQIHNVYQKGNTQE
jgi:glycosyltransferase involved in cell wall biosynthesis